MCVHVCNVTYYIVLHSIVGYCMQQGCVWDRAHADATRRGQGWMLEPLEHTERQQQKGPGDDTTPPNKGQHNTMLVMHTVLVMHTMLVMHTRNVKHI